MAIEVKTSDVLTTTEWLSGDGGRACAVCGEKLEGSYHRDQEHRLDECLIKLRQRVEALESRFAAPLQGGPR
jgi:hypothetical protein